MAIMTMAVAALVYAVPTAPLYYGFRKKFSA